MPSSFKTINEFLRTESASGILLVGAALLALLMANSPVAPVYNVLIDMPLEIRIGPLYIAKPLLLWINDGLMAVFFFLIGLELKREFLEGSLSDIKQISLPAMGAIGGMILPALIYLSFNWDDSTAIKGWAIPAATDIAFALAILMLLGKRVPAALKLFLVTLAIFDDVGAIVIIALFYSDNLSLTALVTAAICLTILFTLNRRKVSTITPYILIGVIMWVAVLKSGVHATLAGILLAMFIPHKDTQREDHSPLKELEHDLHSVVAFVILPVFAFANSGIALTGVGLDYFLHPIPLGVAVGLFIGKPIGVMLFCWISVRTGMAKLPQSVSWQSMFGVSILCGVGFTMSLFIGSLAFEETGTNLLFDERLGIIMGSALSALVGYFYLNHLFKDKKPVT